MDLNKIIELSNTKNSSEIHEQYTSRREDKKRPDFVQRWSQERRESRDEETPEIAKFTPTRSKSPKIQRFLGEISAFKHSSDKELTNSISKVLDNSVSEEIEELKKCLILNESNLKRLTLENSNLRDMLELKDQDIQDKISKIE